MTEEQWINEVYELLCKSQVPESDTQRKNLREWAEAMADNREEGEFFEGMTPREAHDEELSNA